MSQATMTAAIAWSLALSALCAEATPGPKGTGRLTPEQKREVEELRARWESDRNQPILSGIGWTMIHCSSEAARKRAEPVFGAMEEYGKGNEAPLAALGGAKGFVGALRKLLADPDPVMRGFAAVALGAFADPEDRAALVKLLTAPNAKCPGVEDNLQGYHRGRAAMALGLMGAKDCAKAIAALLQSKNEFDRWGAALGLGYLDAREHAPDIARLLADEDDSAKTSAMRALADLQAREYAKDIANLLGADGDPSISETAFATLARLGAKEHAADIAKFLDKEFRRDDAATALAQLGAREYAGDIAKLLNCKNPLDRQAALLALGLLKATEHEQAIAGQLKQKEDEEFVAAAAAAALLLMGSKVQQREAAALFLKHAEYYDGFRPIPKGEVLELKKKAETILKEHP